MVGWLAAGTDGGGVALVGVGAGCWGGVMEGEGGVLPDGLETGDREWGWLTAGCQEVPRPVVPCTVLESGLPVNISKAVTSPITTAKVPAAAPTSVYHVRRDRPPA